MTTPTESVLESYRPLALRMANTILRNQADAEDAVQNAYLSAWARRDTFAGGAGYTSWLYRIVSNSALDGMRRRKNQERYVMPIGEHDHGCLSSVEGRILQDERRKLVFESLPALKSIYRDAIEGPMTDGRDWLQSDGTNTEKVRRNRAVKQLQKIMRQRRAA